MRRNRRPVVREHQHCERCFRLNCKAPIEIPVSCMVISCRLLCGATFHMCKEEEHRLLCPKETVSCLNAAYGCPATMLRSQLAQHLKVCPASVISCSMDWNRWPIADTDGMFYKNAVKEPFSDEHLDLCMALRDQKLVCNKLKVKAFFPELMEDVEEAEDSAEGAMGGVDPTDDESTTWISDCSSAMSDMQELMAKNKDGLDIRNHELAEKMFSKEKGGCMQAAKAKVDGQTPANQQKTQGSSSHQQAEETCRDKNEPETETTDATHIGFAPWDEGVLERLGKEVNPREYNMYIVHHGRMLIRFGQMSACTPRERDFVYGSLEPIPVQTLRSFKVPTSYKEKRIHLKDPAVRAKTEDKSVDTADLGFSEEDIPIMDELQMTLLCSTEKELRGHKICETVVTDGLFVDFATQTYHFQSAPFKRNAYLADIIPDKTLNLHVQIQTDGVTGRHNRTNSAFTFLCNHTFRRDEFSSHFKNVHVDIQSCLNGWFEERCPLAYLGCTYSQKRFQPSTQRATVSYNVELSTLSLRPEVPPSLSQGVKAGLPDRKRERNTDVLSRLPFEILLHIARFLDSFSLSQLALVSQTMREMCATLLKDRGMVSLKWKKKTYAHGGSRWKSQKVWQFSNLFSTVDKWSFAETLSMSEHLKRCSFYQTERKTEPVALIQMCDKKMKR
ncbi:F-box only protein 40-like isoform X1 [Brienomyrus brachyistius]|uniref:F-box only protein 40-like isoform X1 n=1 Tax=Brienomyrus brachyistius TaxID=42636 RepID=UPI0020B1D3E5|nr:F-box only protein 40-like isoform X1 [Brienomyrus brachyistius]